MGERRNLQNVSRASAMHTSIINVCIVDLWVESKGPVRASESGGSRLIKMRGRQHLTNVSLVNTMFNLK